MESIKNKNISSLLKESVKKYIFVSVNGFNEKVNICAC